MKHEGTSTSDMLQMQAMQTLPKCPTGIAGLDDITSGGLPQGRPTLVCGSAGCGKTLLGLEFLVRGATMYGEPGICVSFEETPEELVKNVASLGFDLAQLAAEKKLLTEYVFIERSQIEETGEYDLEGLFIRLGYAIDSIGAKRVLLDTVESLFGGLTNESILRAELRRLFRWLKSKGVTAVITGERGQGTLTRHGLEEYVSDCVILLDHRVEDNVFTRRMRVVKYRGSLHGTNEYPFLIDQQGITVLPLTSLGMRHQALDERLSTGIPELDAMVGGTGVYRGSSILISGTAGTGKTSIASKIAQTTCDRGERCLYFAFEESESQLVRNMRSIGMDLKRSTGQGLLRFEASRPTSFGLELHLVKMHKAINEFKPSVVVVDPITALMGAGSRSDTHSMLLRMIDFLKQEQITAVFTTLTSAAGELEHTQVNISSLVDTWILLRDIELGGERNRGIYVLKARGSANSNQIREFLLTDDGIRIREAYLGTDGFLTGSARVAQETADATAATERSQERERRRLMIERKRHALMAQIAALQVDVEAQEQELRESLAQEELNRSTAVKARRELAKSRKVDNGRED